MAGEGNIDAIMRRRIGRRALLKTTLVGTAAGLVGCQSLSNSESDESGGLPAAAPRSLAARPASVKSVIVIVIDSLRADHLGCYGNDWIKTPNIDALAKESIVFNHAFPQAMPTIPMRLVLHTGQKGWPYRDWVRRIGANLEWDGWGPVPEEAVTLAETLAEQKFQTGFISDVDHYFSPGMNFHRGYGQFLWIRGQELDPYRSRVAVTGDEMRALFDPSVPKDLEGLKYMAGFSVQAYLANNVDRSSEEDYQTPQLYNEAIRWLDENHGAEKSFLLVDGFDPHEPWDPPQEFVDLYDSGYDGPGVTVPLYSPVNYLTDPELKQMRARYAGEVTFVDKWLGRFLDHAREIGVLDDSLLILTADHGHQLAEHGIIGKLPQGLYYELMDVPLIVRPPGGEGGGQRVDALVQHQDIMPTVLDYLGVAPKMDLPGLNLIDVINGKVSERDHVSAGMHNYSWCRNSQYVLMMRNDSQEQHLFDMAVDPLQTHDLAAERSDLAQEMASLLVDDAGGSLPAE
jgi:arylsulfatase A-like enzyme